MNPDHPPITLAQGLRTGTIRLDALAIADARGGLAAPASLLLRLNDADPDPVQIAPGLPRPLRAELTCLAAGHPHHVDQHPESARAARFDLPATVLLPPFVNAHTHLDLTGLGPRPHDPEAGFAPWADIIRRERPPDSGGIRDAVRAGARLSLASGVVAVGDIGGAPAGRPTLTAAEALADSPVSGVSFVEFFAIGTAEQRSLAAIEAFLESEEVSVWLQAGGSKGGVRLGLQPHAPYSVTPAGYRHAATLAARLGLPLSTHLAETIEERRFIGAGDGPNRAFLEQLGLWEDRLLDEFGRGLTPVEHLAPVLDRPGWVLAHVNDATDEDIGRLAAAGASVAYCPRASAYFGNPRALGPHRYRDMLDAGVNVALGTDSVVNLPAGSDDPHTGGFGPLAEARYLFERDGGPASTLLAMATTHGARALGLDERAFVFEPGQALAGVVGMTLDAGKQAADPGEIPGLVLQSEAPGRLLLIGKKSG